MGLVTLQPGTKVLDYSFQKPSMATAKLLGYQGVVGYLPWDPNAVERGCLNHAVIDEILSAGMAWSCVWELNADRALNGFATGIADGNSAGASARGLGAAPGSLVGCVVDFDASPSTIVDYCAGFAETVSGFGFRPKGYGSVRVIDRLVAGTVVQYGWQAEAWSYGQVSPYAHMIQRANYKLISGTDHNDVLKAIPFTGTGSTGSSTMTPEEEKAVVGALTGQYPPFGRAPTLADIVAAVVSNSGRIDAVAAQVAAINAKLDSAGIERGEMKQMLRDLAAAVAQIPGGTIPPGPLSADEVAQSLVEQLRAFLTATAAAPVIDQQPNEMLNRSMMRAAGHAPPWGAPS